MENDTATNFNECLQAEAMFHEGGTSFPDDIKFMEDTNTIPMENHEKEPKFDDLMLQNFSFDSLLQPSSQAVEVNNDQGVVAISESVKYNHKPVPPTPSILASLEILKNYKSKTTSMKGQNINNKAKIESSTNPQSLSTEEIIRIAGERYVKFSAYWEDNIYIPIHPYGSVLGGLSNQENREVELVQLLLAAAERAGYEQYERANIILLHCELGSSACATPVQKIIYYFAQALQERIHRSIGMITTLDGLKTERQELLGKIDSSLPFVTMCFQKIPFCQVLQIAGVQAITESLALETKIHLIDLQMRCGIQWTALMQALADRHDDSPPLKLLKITAIGFIGRNELENIGKRLANFAESLNLPFSFKAVFVRDMIEIKEEHFEMNEEEAVAVNAPYILSTMIQRPLSLENLMSILRRKKPVTMIVIETEASINSPFFRTRFVEALFFFSAYMDCIETCLGGDDNRECRMVMDALFCERIRNVVAKEGEERTRRHVKLDVWRRFFARYKMVEMSFSESSLYQANLVVNKFEYGEFCSLGQNGKSLTVGWKGTPIHSVSAWKFL